MFVPDAPASNHMALGTPTVQAGRLADLLKEVLDQRALLVRVVENCVLCRPLLVVRSGHVTLLQFSACVGSDPSLRISGPRWSQ